jgi:hypothetical protein
MRSRLQARSLRFALAAVVFVVMLGIRIGPIPEDDDDPIVDYGPMLARPLPSHMTVAADAAPPADKQSATSHHSPLHRLHAQPVHRRLHTQTSSSY